MKAPVATYRLQFRDGMTFERAAGLAPYLRRLGVSHLYASPVFAAVEGSTHGYDVVDNNAFDQALGGRDGFERLVEALRVEELGLILDIVPNHMAASPQNPWWRSVLEWGETSPFAGHFDIDWSERLTLPILGQTPAEAIAAGDLALALDRDNGAVAMQIPGALLPLAPSSYKLALQGIELDLVDRVLHLSRQALPANAKAFSTAMRGHFEKDEATALEEALTARSAEPGVLETVHAGQPWRLIHWKEGRRHLSYRRFFEVTGLVGLRVEEEQVFDDVHKLVLELVRDGKVDGLRIDHVDGLADPAAYLTRLREAVGPDVPIHVEKILGPAEALPAAWPVQGTTGYEFIADLADLLVDGDGVDRLQKAYAVHVGRELYPLDEVHDVKVRLIERNFEAEFRTLTAMAADLGMDGQEAAAATSELIAAMPVYRTYGDAKGFGAADLAVLRKAAKQATRRERATPQAVRRLVRLLRTPPGDDADGRAALFRTRFQQLSGPIMAKAVEDTFFYRHHPLIALNEVGSEPDAEPRGIDAFHEAMRVRQRRQPLGLSATATHDTKRGEDARARLYSLAEHADSWIEAVGRWSGMNDADGVDRETEWMIYQALGGVWPSRSIADDGRALGALCERFLPFLQKALREAKVKTDWVEPDEAYEGAVEDFASRLLGEGGAAFRQDFERTLRPILEAGRINALSQTLVKLLAPGVPDIYQGSEGEDLSLVDPDNRRPPDFDRLADALAREREPAEPLSKMHLMARGLRLRQEHPDLFRRGRYLPLALTGPKAAHGFAFARRYGREVVVAVGVRLPGGLFAADGSAGTAWEGTVVEVPEIQGGGTELLSGRRIALGTIALDGLLTPEQPVAAIEVRI